MLNTKNDITAKCPSTQELLVSDVDVERKEKKLLKFLKKNLEGIQKVKISKMDYEGVYVSIVDSKLNIHESYIPYIAIAFPDTIIQSSLDRIKKNLKPTE